LHVALDIALPFHDLHYFNSSSSSNAAVIVHDDAKLDQYLCTNRNKLKLNDFNEAEIMFFNNVTKQCCKFKNGKIYGSVE